MTKHIGKHNGKKVIVIIHQLEPPSEHMALIVYSDSLPAVQHDAIIRVLESATGQQAPNLVEPLSRDFLPDGRIITQVLHEEGRLKKVPACDVLMMPFGEKKPIRLDELNSIVAQLKAGGEGAKRLEELDRNAGMRGPNQPPKKAEVKAKATSLPVVKPDESGVITDESLAKSYAAQSVKLKTDAIAFLTEAKRLEEQANILLGVKSETVKKAAKKGAVKKVSR